MADLSSINTELMELQRFMGSDRLRLSNKEEDLKRLEKALSDLGRNKSDFTDTKEICLEPECAANSLLGDNADDLDALKEDGLRSEEHTSELQSRFDLVCRLLLEKKKRQQTRQKP